MGRLLDYLDSVKARDPAPRSRAEILLYPGVWALGFHRVAHALFRQRLFFLARLVNHVARMATAIDIHPGARIGRNFFIDHGFTVIGETAEIGDDVTIYQCVTLGGTDPANGIAGKRHPTIGDGAIIGSGAQVLGPIVIGARARVGANAVVTKDVPEGAIMVGIPAKPTLVDVTEYQKPFTPYGTPCNESCDPLAQKLTAMQAEIDRLRTEVEGLKRDQPAADRKTPAPGSENRRLMGSVSPFPAPGQQPPQQTAFDRAELSRIMDLYGRMVAAGHWRDYAIDLRKDEAIFSAFRRATERPEFRIEKRPALRNRQGMWALVAETGAVLRRGHELGPILAPVERRLMKLVGD